MGKITGAEESTERDREAKKHTGCVLRKKKKITFSFEKGRGGKTRRENNPTQRRLYMYSREGRQNVKEKQIIKLL